MLSTKGYKGDTILLRLRFTSTIFCIFALTTVIFGRPYFSYADINENLAISPVSISLANNCTADPPGIAAIHYNPAGLSNLPSGNWISQGFILPWVSIHKRFTADQNFPGFMDTWGPQPGQIHDPVAGKSATNYTGLLYIPIANKTIDFLGAPTSALSARTPGSRWTFAFMAYMPFGGGFKYRKNSAARWLGTEFYQQHLVYAAPTASYQVSPTLSLGISVGFGQTAMGGSIDQRMPNELVALTKVLGNATKGLEIPILSELTMPPPWFGGGIGPYDYAANVSFTLRDDFSPNYNLGLLWQPRDWFAFGACYQSEIKVQMSGHYNMSYGEAFQRMTAWQGSSPLLLVISGMLDLPTHAVPYQAGNLYTSLKFPQRLQTGIMLRPTKRLKLLFDAGYTNWSVQDKMDLHFDQEIQAFKLAKLLAYPYGNYDLVTTLGLKDTIDYGIGVEYKLNNKLTLRCGYERRPTSVPKKYYGLLPFPDLDYYAAGFGLKLPHQTTLNVALGLMINTSYTVPDNGSTNLNSTDFTNLVYNPYAGLNYKQRTTIIIGSFEVVLPFEAFIKMQKDMMQKQQEAIHHLISILNPLK